MFPVVWFSYFGFRGFSLRIPWGWLNSGFRGVWSLFRFGFAWVFGFWLHACRGSGLSFCSVIPGRWYVGLFEFSDLSLISDLAEISGLLVTSDLAAGLLFLDSGCASFPWSV